MPSGGKDYAVLRLQTNIKLTTHRKNRDAAIALKYRIASKRRNLGASQPTFKAPPDSDGREWKVEWLEVKEDRDRARDRVTRKRR